MTKKKITSRPGFFGTIKHYDSHGNKIGESRPGLFGTMNHYDSKGHKSWQQCSWVVWQHIAPRCRGS